MRHVNPGGLRVDAVEVQEVVWLLFQRQAADTDVADDG